MFLTYAFIVYVLFTEIVIFELTTAQPPTWETGTSFSKTSSECTEITTLIAKSETSDMVQYTVHSQTPNGGFDIGTNIASDLTLTCVTGSISQQTYVVVVRANYSSDPGESDLTITITFTDKTPATGPTWNTGTSHTLDKGDNNACNSVVSLSATSTDSSTVIYSIQGSSIFSITGGNILSCTIGDVTQSSYTVVVRANQGNNVHTDLTLTISVTDSSAGSGDSSTEEESDNRWKYGVAFGTVGAVGVAVGVTVFAFKVPKRRKDKKDRALGKSSGGIMHTHTNIVKPEGDVEKSPLPRTTDTADKVLTNGDVTV